MTVSKFYEKPIQVWLCYVCGEWHTNYTKAEGCCGQQGWQCDGCKVVYDDKAEAEECCCDGLGDVL